MCTNSEVNKILIEIKLNMSDKISETSVSFFKILFLYKIHSFLFLFTL